MDRNRVHADIDLDGNDVRPAILSYEMALDYSTAAERLSKKVNCHIKLDTGMGRIGFSCEETGLSEIQKIFSLKNLVPEGIFTHFARADEAGREATDRQFSLFTHAIEELSKKDCPLISGIAQIQQPA